MTLTETAAQHVRSNNLKGRTPIHHASRWERLTGITDPADVTTDAIEQFRSTCRDKDYAVRSTEGCISDVLMLVYLATGKRLDPGRRDRKPRPRPQPTPIDVVDLILPHCPSWVRQWIGLTWATCLRSGDCLSLQRSLKPGRLSLIEWQASKTGHQHQFPVPDWLQVLLLERVFLPGGKTYCRLQDQLRDRLTRACQSAGVDRVLPKHIRQRALTEWSRADAMAGRIIHGCGLGVLDHYVDPLTVLESASHRVRLPAQFGGNQKNSEGDLINIYRRLDPEAQQIVSSTVRRLA